jgi:hypothetical protein
MFLGSKVRRVRRTDNLTTISEPMIAGINLLFFTYFLTMVLCEISLSEVKLRLLYLIQDSSHVIMNEYKWKMSLEHFTSFISCSY